MSNPFVAEIRVFGFNFAPTGWAFCDGQLLPISQNTALFSLLGTTYGGDGQSTFALPDLQGCAATFWGQGPGLQLWDQGQLQGSETVTLLQSEIPVHTHTLSASTANANSAAAANAQLAKAIKGGLQASTTAKMYSNIATPATTMSPFALAMAGGNLPHNNMMPYLTLNFCIALQGVFPARN